LLWPVDDAAFPRLAANRVAPVRCLSVSAKATGADPLDQAETRAREPEFKGPLMVCGYNSRLCKRRNVNRRKSDMPIYAYRCESCSFEKDALQKMSDAPLTQCPQCGKETFVKQVTAAGFQLKGSGWYVTDFRGGNNGAAAAKKEEGGKKEEGAKAETKSDGASDSGNSSKESSKDSGNQSSKTDSSTASAPAAGSSKSGSTTSAAASSSKPASPASN
jgi:putative FmdB family regulatory protein